MTVSEKRLLDSILRNNLVCFIAKVFQEVSPGDVYEHNWHIDLIADCLLRCTSGEVTRQIINVPPRYLKSICVSIALPAWILGHDPFAKIICASYASELSLKLARDCRQVMESAWYKRIFPETRLNRITDTDLVTTKGGMRYATSVAGSITGLGGDYIIIDDAIKPEDVLSDAIRKKTNDWFNHTLYSRLNNKRKSTIIVIMQRLHVDDFVSHIMEKDVWDVLTLPAIAEDEQIFELTDGRVIRRRPGDVLHPEREPLDVLKNLENIVGEYNFSAQYQQQPIPPEGNLIKWKWFNYHDITQTDRADHIVQSWDTATKDTELASYSVCMTLLLRGENYYLLDVFRDKLEFPDLYAAVLNLAARYRPRSILIEDKSSGTQLIQTIKKRQANLPTPYGIVPRVEKVVRMAAQALKIKEGKVFLLNDAAWLPDFRSECLAFPNSAHKDQVDALSQFLQWTDDRNSIREVRLLGL